jgi:type I restriction enzyme, S subunit
MTPDRFLEKFSSFAEAPGAAAKMRELVLQLAVQGRLVGQRHDEGNAAQLLTEISQERDSRIAKLRTPGEPEPQNEEEHPFSIPPTWAWTQLGKVVLQIQYGYTASADLGATDIRMLRITDIQNNRVDWASVPGCQIEREEAEKYLLGPNDILIARTGGTIGKSFIVPDVSVKSVFASYLIRVTPPRSMSARYLKTFLESPLYWDQLRSMSAGTGQPNVNGQALGRLRVPLPPVAEQKRIAAKVDELMALCDRLEAQQKERETQNTLLGRASLSRFADAPTPANLAFLFHRSYSIPPADLRKSILTLAVRGRLVRSNPDDEPASELIKNIEVDKKKLSDSGHIKTDKKAWVNSPATPPHDIPDAWRWVRIQDVFEISRGGSPRPAGDPQFFGGSIPWITVGEITKDSRKYLTETRMGLTEEGSKRSRFINPGDLLLTNSGATLGVPKISCIRGCMNDGVAVLRQFHSYDLNDFAYLYLTHETPAFRSVKQGMGQPNLNTPIIAGWLFPLPPLAEQRRIVAKVDQLMTLVDELETQLANSRVTAAKLLDAIVAALTGVSTGGAQ